MALVLQGKSITRLVCNQFHLELEMVTYRHDHCRTGLRLLYTLGYKQAAKGCSAVFVVSPASVTRVIKGKAHSETFELCLTTGRGSAYLLGFLLHVEALALPNSKLVCVTG